MGLLDFFRGGRRKVDNGVRGVAHVASATGYHGEGVLQNCRMQLVIQVPGLPATPVEFSGVVHNQKWPFPGMQLPVIVNAVDPTEYSIQWDEMPRSRDRAADAAQALAASMNRQPGATGVPPGALGGFSGAQVVNLSGRDLSTLTHEQRAKLQAFGLDPDALVAAQTAAPTANGAPPPPPADDTISRLERLAVLRAQGVLTETEFQTQKQAVLDAR